MEDELRALIHARETVSRFEGVLLNKWPKLIALLITLLSADWPQWRGPNRDGVAHDLALPATWPKKASKMSLSPPSKPKPPVPPGALKTPSGPKRSPGGSGGDPPTATRPIQFPAARSEG